jgi:hypothetical protein
VLYCHHLFQLYFKICHEEGPRKQEELDWNGTHQLLVYTDDVNLLGKNLKTIKKTQILQHATKELFVEVNTKTKFISCIITRMQVKIKI